MKIASQQHYYDLLDGKIDNETSYVIGKAEDILGLKKNYLYNKARRKGIEMGLFIGKSTITGEDLFTLLYK